VRALAIATSLGLAALAAPGRARAQETTHGGPPGDDLLAPRADAATPASDADDARRPDALIDPSMSRTWREGRPRLFAATTVDAGYLYLRPRVSLGWGKPFQTWIGLDANPILVSSGVGAYGGVRFAVPYADLRVGARWFGAFQHAYLDPQPSYDRLDIDDTRRGKARFVTLESELTIALPAGPGDVVALGSISSVEGVPDDAYVFEETLHIVTAPPLVWRARGGYVLRVGPRGQHSIGLVADVLDVPKRDDSTSLRAGPVARIVFSRHLELRGSFVMTLVSPDRLGLVGGDFTELGLRWRTATR
jgi:hypothetical protein